MTKKPYEIVVGELIKAIESAVSAGAKLPWQMPWQTSGKWRNMATKHCFTGFVNLFMLYFLGEGCKRFATANQIKKAGATYSPNARWIYMLLPVFVPVVDEKTGKPKLRKNGQPMTKLVGFRYYTVTADKYIQGGKFPKHEQDIDESKLIEFVPSEKAESIIALHDELTIQETGEQACYIPSLDEIRMPKKETFLTIEDYYFSIFHEIAHWAKKRVGHDSNEDCKEYAFEELVAEFTACIVATEAGIDFGKIRFDNSVAYLKNWMERLKANPNWLTKAARLAEERAKFILDPTTLAKDESDDKAA